MSVLVATKTFSIGTGAASSTVAVTGIGFQPKVLIFTWSGRTEGSDSCGLLDQKRGMGWAISSTSRRVMTSQSEEGQSVSDCDVGILDNECIAMISNAGAWSGQADLQSMDSDGFTLVIDQQFTTDLKVTVQALGGDDIEEAYIGSFLEPSSTGWQEYTDPGFTPSAVLFMQAANLTSNGINASSRFMVGMMAGDDAQNGLIIGGGQNGQGTTQTAHYCLDGECVGTMNYLMSSIAARGSGIWGRQGFWINWSEVPGDQNRRYHYIAIKGGAHALRTGLTQTDTSTSITFSSLNMRVLGGMVFSSSNPENSSDTVASTDEISIGSFTGEGTNHCHCCRDADAATTTEPSCAIEYDSVYANIGASETIEGLMYVYSMSNDSISFRMSDADPSQGFFFTWLIGDTPRNKSIIIESVATYYDANLNNLPQKVDEKQVDSEFWSNVQNGGGDIIVKDSSGNRVPIDLRRCDTSAQKLCMYIIGDFSSSGGNQFTITYDSDYTASQPEIGSTYGARNVYVDNFQLAMNLDENSTTFVDNSWYFRNGSGQGTLPNQVAGKNNYAQDFNGSSDYINLGDVIEGLSQWTELAWINLDSESDEWTQIECKDQCSSFARHYTGGQNRAHANCGNGSTWGTGTDGTANLSLSTWYHFCALGLSNNYTQIYIDGVYDTQGNTGYTMGSNSDRRLIGAQDSGGGEGGHFNGRIETLWITSDNKSAAWIKAVYRGQNDTDDVWSVVEGGGGFLMHPGMDGIGMRNFNSELAGGMVG